ncbi:MAG: phytoene synthase [Bacteroidetes bacterium RIFCSPHIGHO2_02_FULL_44_7]|nr:MAG: phytoene synthase [Bacteroidetes bacterium RIFCSPHIGHO2_02_FULL_44_7]
MKSQFDVYSNQASKEVTKRYSTSFYTSANALDKNIRLHIHNIYGFVRLADEIVDSFQGYDQTTLLAEFSKECFLALERGISLNPILNSFQMTVNQFNIDHALIHQFLHSMEMDLHPRDFTHLDYEEYIFGSAEVVGLMCLKIFVNGKEEEYIRLKPYAMKLGSAFQKINFLRDLRDDYNELGRIYFPNIDINNIQIEDKLKIEAEIRQEFNEALIGIKQLPKKARFGVYVCYKYYTKLLKEIERRNAKELLQERIRVRDSKKLLVFANSYIRNSFNLL